MGTLPTGTVTFLFTDIEGSTQLWEKHPEAMKSALAKHDSILRGIFLMHNGQIVKITGDGFHVVFVTAADAVNAAVHSQQALQKEGWGDAVIKARMGLHTGESELRDGDYFGQTPNRAARIMSAGHGGQVLMSDVAAQVAREHLSSDASLLDLGMYHLKGLLLPEHIFQLCWPGLQNNFPSLNSIPTATNNLPMQLTSFIGRERELAEAEKRLDGARLLTLIGPGGTGKTRLSLQIGADQVARFKDGVWLVELASVSDASYIISTIASVFEIREVQNIPLIQLIADYLRARELLLILDNCEHLVEASAQVADQLLHVCPNLKIVASSREALGIDGETVYRVPSLKDDEATRLFVERAAKADSRFKMTEHNASFIAQICSRLDGIPLAIELAAARVKLFPPEQIARRLDDRFKLLTGGSRTALPRQQTLRALIDWSYQSLHESEQRALRRLAVFAGGWTIEGAESVLGESEAMESLTSLVNKSLVNVEEGESESRFRFLETIRQYAMEKLLESGETVDARDHHLDYVLQIAEKSEQKMFGSESLEWLDQMEVEHDNLRAALEWSASNDLGKALQLAINIGGFWTSRDYYSEAREWCRVILERSESLEGVDLDRARVYALWGWTAITTGNHKEGRAVAWAGLELARKVDDKQSIVRLLVVLGLSTLYIGDFSASLTTIAEGITLARQMGFKGELAMALTAHAQASFHANQDLTTIGEKLEEAMKLANEAGFQWVSAMSAYGVGRMAGYMGELDVARAHMNRGVELSKQMGNKRMVYSSRSELAHILREHGLLDEAYEIYKEALPGWKDLGHRAAIAHELECIAYILIRREEPDRAARLFGAAENLREIIDTEMTSIERKEYEKEVAALRDMLGENEFKRTWGEGRALTMEQAIHLAVQ